MSSLFKGLLTQKNKGDSQNKTKFEKRASDTELVKSKSETHNSTESQETVKIQKNIDNVKQKIKSTTKNSNMLEEDLIKFSRNLADPTCLKLAYLNKNFDHIREMVKFKKRISSFHVPTIVIHFSNNSIFSEFMFSLLLKAKTLHFFLVTIPPLVTLLRFLSLRN